MLSSTGNTNTAIQSVIIDYNELIAGEDSESWQLGAKIERAFGSRDDALGLLLIKNVPGYTELRKRLLLLASDLANLNESELNKLVDSESRYMFGWSRGKEIMNGKLDFAKGSFYANPRKHAPINDPKLLECYPEYFRPNIWPEALPELEPAFCSLANLMLDVAALVARHMDGLLSQLSFEYAQHSANLLESMVRETRCNKGRLLHYYPRSHQADTDLDSWCGWHLDHSCLTVLTAAMFVDEQKRAEAQLPVEEESGLYIRTRSGQVVRVVIPEDCLAMQTGEALEIASGNRLKATPHCVRSPGGKAAGLARNTLAVFVQPDCAQELKPGYTFAEFTKEVISSHLSPMDK